MGQSGLKIEKNIRREKMRLLTPVVLLVIIVMLMGCNGAGNGNKVKTGCMSLVKLIR